MTESVTGSIMKLLTIAQAAQQFVKVLNADPAAMAPDVVFDRHSRLLTGERYLPVGFQKR